MTNTMLNTKSCLILDCFSLTYRAFFGLPTTIRTREGHAINAALGFYNTVHSLINQFRPDYIIVASDMPVPTFRHNLFPEYKGQRPPMPEDLKSQLPLIRDIIAGLEIPLMEVAGYEADDIIGTIAANLLEDTNCFIVTTDRDVLQLVADDVTVVVPNSRENKIYTPEIVLSEWGVPPQRIPDVKALMGDSSDNIPGVPLVGPKTAVRWLSEYKSLENLLENTHLLKGKAGLNLANNHEAALLYKELATIDCNVPTVPCWQKAALGFDQAKLRDTLEGIGIRAAIPNVS